MSPDTSHSPASPRAGRRRSSVYNSFQDMLSAGGPNSINNFASSYSRSAQFIQADFDVNAERPKTLGIGPTYTENTSLIHHHHDVPTYQPLRSDMAVMSEEEEEDFEGRSIRSVVLENTGTSTAPQTIFNGINTLIGIGLLALPLGLRYAGWVFGTIILALCALSTQYSAKVLARCMKKDQNLKTYGDIAYYSFGRVAYIITVGTFTLDLLSAGTSMIIIFADSFNALTGIDRFVFKCIICVLFFISSFLELRVLSHFSLVGIICTSLIVLTVLFCGFRKTEAPGSLIDISPTALWPTSTLHLLLSVGIFMSPFGGHAIFPELYRDMQHPQKYEGSCTTIFSFTWLIDYIMASLGYLMFGLGISDQVTKSIMNEKGFPSWIKIMIAVFMGILPISKGPLILRPLITMADQVTLHRVKHEANKSNSLNIIKFINRLATVSVFFTAALVFTDFGKIMSFLGSAICFAVCLIFPLSFYLKLHYKEMPLLQKAVYFISIFAAIFLAVAGTAAVAIA